MQIEKRSAEEAGWQLSRYNLMADIPGSDHTAIVNLFKKTCVELDPVEMLLLSNLAGLDEDDPMVKRFAKYGLICNFDEVAALETLGHVACAISRGIWLTICPTMACNFDCPYCFENHGQGKMSPEVQDDVVSLAERLMNVSGSANLNVRWFGGEPLLAPDVIEALSERLVDLVEKRGGKYSASITTNGYFLDQDNVSLLARAKVERAHITIDGMGAAHDATRHLTGGGPTFDRIIHNLKENRIPFAVIIRHNVHAENKGEIEELKAFIGKLAEESGNRFRYYAAPIGSNDASVSRGSRVALLCGNDASQVSIIREARRFRPRRGHYCGAQAAWFLGVDEKGNLYKCSEILDKPSLSFGTAHDWNPLDALGTATCPGNLLGFLHSTATVFDDDECKKCVWLPLCSGGCPYRRLTGERACLPFKDDAQGYVLACYDRRRSS